MKVYRAGRKGANLGRWWEDYKDARKVFRDRLRGLDGPYRWKTKAQKDWSDEADLAKVMRNTDKLTPGMGEDNAFWAKSGRAVIVIDVGEEHVTIPKAPDGISPSITRAHNLTFTKVEQLDREDADTLRVVTMGYTVCKLISGTRVPSQHCPGPPSPDGGNAMDWVVKRGDGSVDISATDKVVAYLGSEGFPEVLWRGVPSHYPNHAHTSGSPKRSGWPSCL